MQVEMVWDTFSAMCSMKDSCSSNPSIVSTGDMVDPLLESVPVLGLPGVDEDSQEERRGEAKDDSADLDTLLLFFTFDDELEIVLVLLILLVLGVLVLDFLFS